MDQSTQHHQEKGSIYDQLTTPLPRWADEYLAQRERALMTEIHEIRRLRGLPPLPKVRTRTR